MNSLSFMMFIVKVYLASCLALPQNKKFMKVRDNARIQSTSISKFKGYEHTTICALVCFKNSKCSAFVYKFAKMEQCELFQENLEEMKIVAAENWTIFAVKSETFIFFKYLCGLCETFHILYFVRWCFHI